MKFINIPTGSYLIGAVEYDTDALDNEAPSVPVTVDGFSLAEHLVTIKEFHAFIEETGYFPSEGALYFDGEDWQMGEELSWNDPGYSYMDDTPVTCVNFSDVNSYIQWKSDKDGGSYRLPTEAEWEYAARAGTSTIRFWGDSMERAQEYANIQFEGGNRKLQFKYASPVGFFLPNQWGLFDMLGNVFELTGSDYVEKFNGQELECSNSDDLKVYRGGSFNADHSIVRCSARAGFPVALASNQIGFRLAC